MRTHLELVACKDDCGMRGVKYTPCHNSKNARASSIPYDIFWTAMQVGTAFSSFSRVHERKFACCGLSSRL